MASAHLLTSSVCRGLFFKGNLFLGISKTHLKAIFTVRLQSSPSAYPPLRLCPPPRLLIWHSMCCKAHSLAVSTVFDLILKAICNPLQNSETRSPATPHLYIELSICLLCPLLSQGFTTITNSTPHVPPTPSSHPPTYTPMSLLLLLWNFEHIYINAGTIDCTVSKSCCSYSQKLRLRRILLTAQKVLLFIIVV